MGEIHTFDPDRQGRTVLFGAPDSQRVLVSDDHVCREHAALRSGPCLTWMMMAGSFVWQVSGPTNLAYTFLPRPTK